MTKLHLPITEMPGVLRESLRSSLAAHGFVLAVCDPRPHPDDAALVEVSPAQLEAFLDHAGRCATQSVFAINANLQTDELVELDRLDNTDSDAPRQS